ncbi:MAG TPA: FtsW/RodA/SpoVE family cell cycle protein [Candidatus Paceibacterota bacterium]
MPDRLLSWIVGTLAVAGLGVYVSASLGLAARGAGSPLADMLAQVGLGFLGGGLLAWLLSRAPQRWLRAWATPVFVLALLVTALTLVPSLGILHGGARRWLALGPVSVQPAEFLKFAYVLLLAGLLSRKRRPAEAGERRSIVAPYLIATVPVATILALQPDRDNLALVALAGAAMAFAAGLSWRAVAAGLAIGVLAVAALLASSSYTRERVQTFLHPAEDPLGSGYQVQQSTLAVGAGEEFGRGFGQSLQKFRYLPEPTSDSIFAVAAEEFGFLGSLALVLLFAALGIRTLVVAGRAPERFGALLCVGVGVLVTAQAFLNIGSMIGLVPLAGLALPLVSKGGTALLATLGALGAVLGASRKSAA